MPEKSVKSNKSTARDKPKHSILGYQKNQGAAGKDGAGGKGSWGSEKDVTENFDTGVADPNDPNYDETLYPQKKVEEPTPAPKVVKEASPWEKGNCRLENPF